jgi:hypothetical protein
MPQSRDIRTRSPNRILVPRAQYLALLRLEDFIDYDRMAEFFDYTTGKMRYVVRDLTDRVDRAITNEARLARANDDGKNGHRDGKNGHREGR